MTGQTHRRRRNRQGQSMIEMLMILPFLALILGLIFFFGWSMTHQQQVVSATRYGAWRGVDSGQWPGEAQVNDAWFEQQAGPLDVDYPVGPSQTVDEFVLVLGQADDRAAMLAEEAIGNRAPKNNRAEISAEFASNVGLYSRFQGPIVRDHSREGRPWRRGQMALEVSDAGAPISLPAEYFFNDLDEILQSIPDPGTSVGTTFRDLYVSRW